MRYYYKARKLKRVKLKRKRNKKPLWICLLTFFLFVSTFVYFFSRDWNGPIEASVSPVNERLSGVKAGDNPDVQGKEEKKGAKAVAGGDTVSQEKPDKKDPSPPEVEVREGTISSGQTMTSILNDFLDPAEIFSLEKKCSEVYSLNRIRTGQNYRIRTVQGRLQGFEYEIDDKQKLVVQRQGDSFKAGKKPIVYDVRKVMVSGEIESSLFQAAHKIGETSALPVRLAQIFAWDVDFVKDIRSGDSFKALIEKRYRKGKFSGYGRILAARFVNKGQKFNAFLFEESGGRCDYFDENGDSVRKAFLKAPLEFSRISSGYSNNRLHPILNVRRPHHGIDYAAPTGTPIKSIGDGKVITRSYAKGAGRYIKIRHNSIYTTVYNHMSRYARGLHVGEQVKQGDTIGYVGATGYATGPHLDFRMKKHGEYVNPLKVESPPVEPVPEKDMARFNAQVNKLMAALNGETRMAEKESKEEVVTN